MTYDSRVEYRLKARKLYIKLLVQQLFCLPRYTWDKKKNCSSFFSSSF